MTRVLRRWVGRLDEYDGWLLGAVFVLCLLGTLMVYEAGSFRPEALSAGQGSRHSASARSIIQCQPMSASAADRMIMPTRPGST